jgi:formylmethanofuran dehydrogenase subunit E
MTTLQQDCERAIAYHGHVCGGIVMGIRMARLGCAHLGIGEPRGDRDLVVFVEMARCATDAVYAVTGVTLGKRRLKLVDHGKMAMTLVDGRSGKAVRVRPRSGAPRAPHGADPIAFLAPYSDEDLFLLQEVSVSIPPEDRPGPPVRVAVCARCGEEVVDGREVAREGSALCRSCAYGAYYAPSSSSARSATEGRP